MRVGLDIRITLHREPPKQDGARSRAGLVAALGGSAILHLLSALLLVFYGLSFVPPPKREPAEPPPMSVTFTPFRAPESREPPRGDSATGPIPRRVPAPRPPPPEDAAPPSSSAALRPATPPRPSDPVAAEGTERVARAQPPIDRSIEGAPRTSAPTDLTPGMDASPGRSETRTDDTSLRRALADWRRGHEAERAPAGAGAGGSHDNVFVPDPGSFPVRGAPYGILEFESRDYDWGDYSSQIYWAILRAWYRRLHDTTPDFEKWAHENGEWILAHQTRIRFVIEKNGDVGEIAVETGSGCAPLDRSAVDALSEVVLPPLPADFPRGRETVHGTFIARGDIAGMRQTFRYLKQINYF